MSNDVQPYGWVISYTYMGEAKQAFHRHNAIGDYRDLDPSATSVAVFAGSAPVRQPLTPEKIDEVYRHVWSTVKHDQRLTAFAHSIYGIKP